MEFYEKLRKIRKENGMSQEELASQLSVSRQAVSKWESGQGYPEMDKLLLISELFHVSLDYLLKGNTGEAPTDADTENSFYASRESVEGYLLAKRRGSLWIGAGVAILILGIIFPIMMQDILGSVLLMCFAAAGVGILVSRLFVPKRYEELESRPLVFDPAFLREFRSEYFQQRKRYGVLIVAGVVLCILSFLVGMLSDTISSEHSLTCLMPVFWAVAVYLFIVAGSALNAMNLILNNEAHIKEMNCEEQHSWLWGVVMPLATLIFLVIGFVWGAWHPAWIVFPFASLLCIAISKILDARK